MSPRGLPIGKVEIVNITCDVLAVDSRDQKLVSAQAQSYLGEKRKRRKVAGRWRRKNGMRGAEGERRGQEDTGRINTERKGTVWLRQDLTRNKGLGCLRTSLEEDI